MISPIYRSNSKTLIPMDPCVQSSRRRAPRVRAQRGRIRRAGQDLWQHLETDLDQYVTPEGTFVHWGWLSASEMSAGLTRIGLKSKVVLKQSFSHFCDLPHIPEGTACVFLVRNHYICVANVLKKLIFFDPLCQHSTNYFGREVKQLCPVNMHVQPFDSPHCGNYCLFFLHMLYREVPILRHSKDTVISAVRESLARYLYVHPQNLQHNSMLMEMFTADFKIGEEYEKHRRFLLYESNLSRRALSLT